MGVGVSEWGGENGVGCGGGGEVGWNGVGVGWG